MRKLLFNYKGESLTRTQLLQKGFKISRAYYILENHGTLGKPKYKRIDCRFNSLVEARKALKDDQKIRSIKVYRKGEIIFKY